MQLWWFVPDLADRANFGAFLIVYRYGTARGEGQVETKVVGFHDNSLCAPDRERWVASACSGSTRRRSRYEKEESQYKMNSMHVVKFLQSAARQVQSRQP